MKTDLVINNFLVSVFNEILKREERQLKDKGILDLSIVEVHVLEAVYKCNLEQQISTMSAVADELNISMGSLTISSNRLIKKGYLNKLNSKTDGRKKILELTNKGLYARTVHEAWHIEMTQNVKDFLDEDEYKVLGKTLEKLHEFFLENKE